MGNSVTLTFAGDSDQLSKESRKASQSVENFGKSATDASEQLGKASKGSGDFLDRVGKLGAAVSGAGSAIDDASGVLQGFIDIQGQSYERSQRQKRALQDVKQAQQDYNQAVRDSRQAVIDAGQAQVDKEQADLDAKKAFHDYNTAVKEHGKNSDEAKQALIDLHQAQQDQKQAVEDGKQATEDGKQAAIDAKDAQLDLNDAMKEAHPPDLQKWSDDLNAAGPILSGLIGIIGLITTAQWLWNAAQLASPTTWIVVGILALIAVIVLIATKTHWFQDVWKAAWGGIKAAAHAVGSWFKDTLWGKWIRGAWDGIKNAGVKVWDWMNGLPGKLKGAFAKVSSFISAPFRAAFNFISDAWNNTIGQLSWSVPGWIPGIGGQTIGVPHLPHFHSGGVVPGTPGSEVLTVLQAGERVNPAVGSGSGDTIHVTVMLDSGVLVEGTAKEVRRRGGNVQLVLGGRNA